MKIVAPFGKDLLDCTWSSSSDCKLQAILQKIILNPARYWWQIFTSHLFLLQLSFSKTADLRGFLCTAVWRVESEKGKCGAFLLIVGVKGGHLNYRIVRVSLPSARRFHPLSCLSLDAFSCFCLSFEPPCVNSRKRVWKSQKISRPCNAKHNHKLISHFPLILMLDGNIIWSAWRAQFNLPFIAVSIWSLWLEKCAKDFSYSVNRGWNVHADREMYASWHCLLLKAVHESIVL